MKGASLRHRSRALIVAFALLLAAAPAHAAPKKSAAPKPKDFVGKADQKRDRAGLFTFESGAYRITTDVDKTLANDIAAHMDAVYREYHTRLAGFKPNPYAAVRPDERMPLYVIRKYEDYVNFLADFGVQAMNTGGVFFRRDRNSGLATWVEGQSRLKMYYVLQHEGFHQFADARIMNGLPPWVNEGLAEYFADAIMVDGRLLIGRLDRERIERVREAVRTNTIVPFSKLMTMNNYSWNGRVTGGDKSAALMYDTAWSICFYLIHGGKGGKPLKVGNYAALEAYLLLLNHNFVRQPGIDPGPNAFAKVFSNNLAEFERQWKRGLDVLDPDPWLSSVRHLQYIAAALRAFHEKKIEIDSWPKLKEEMARVGFRARIRERDAGGGPGGENPPPGTQPADDGKADAPNYDFPKVAEVEFVPSTDPKLPAGMRITNVSPNIVLSWSIGASGEVEEHITFTDPPKIPPPGKKPAGKPASKPVKGKP